MAVISNGEHCTLHILGWVKSWLDSRSVHFRPKWPLDLFHLFGAGGNLCPTHEGNEKREASKRMRLRRFFVRRSTRWHRVYTTSRWLHIMAGFKANSMRCARMYLSISFSLLIWIIMRCDVHSYHGNRLIISELTRGVRCRSGWSPNDAHWSLPPKIDQLPWFNRVGSFVFTC